MPANKKRKARAFDIQILFAARLAANTQAHSWAAKCIALREAGKTGKADAHRSACAAPPSVKLTLFARGSGGNTICKHHDEVGRASRPPALKELQESAQTGAADRNRVRSEINFALTPVSV